jgi:hypothetical protein
VVPSPSPITWCHEIGMAVVPTVPFGIAVKGVSTRLDHKQKESKGLPNRPRVEEKECTSALVKIGEGQTTPAIFYHDKLFWGPTQKT